MSESEGVKKTESEASKKTETEAATKTENEGVKQMEGGASKKTENEGVKKTDNEAATKTENEGVKQTGNEDVKKTESEDVKKTESEDMKKTESEGVKKKGDVVIVAVDGSEFSDYALQFYIDNLHKPENHVLLVHSTEYKCVTFPAVTIMSGDPTMSMLTEEIKAEEQKTDQLVAKLMEKTKDIKNFDCEIVRLRGEPGPTIIHLAEEKHAVYIVVGCRGKSSVRRTFTGSVTDYIAHHASVPVMVARHREHLEKHHHGLHGFHLNPFHHKHKHNHDHGKKKSEQ